MRQRFYSGAQVRVTGGPWAGCRGVTLAPNVRTGAASERVAIGKPYNVVRILERDALAEIRPDSLAYRPNYPTP